MSSRLLPLALLLCLGLTAYWSALGNPLLFDDALLISDNQNLTWSRAPWLTSGDYFRFFPVEMVSYRPLSVLSYMLNRSLWGEDYRLWRAGYLLLHILNAWLLYLFFSRAAASRLASFLAAVFFLLHPVHSEVINQVSFNEEVMATFFLLLAWLAFAAGPGGGRWRTPAVATGYALALASKETALFLPLAAAAWTATRGGAGADERGEGGGDRVLLPVLAGVGGCYVLIRFFLLANPEDTRAFVISGRGAMEIAALFTDYLGRLVWPSDLSPVYQQLAVRWWHPAVVAGFLLLAAVAAAVAAGFTLRRPGLAVPGIWFLTGMAPLAYNLTFHHEVIAYDRYLYYPSIGLVWYALLGARALGRRVPSRPPAAATFGGALAAVCAVLLLAATIHRNGAWSSDLALWSDAVRTNPASPKAHYNLALALAAAGRPGEAADRYRQAIRLDPDHVQAHNNLGQLLQEAGRPAEATAHYRQALRVDAGHAEAHHNLAFALRELGRFDEADRHYRRAQELNPAFRAETYVLTGRYLFRRGQYADADDALAAALRIDPDNAEAVYLRALVLARLGRGDEARGLYGRLMRLDPSLAEEVGEALKEGAGN